MVELPPTQYKMTPDGMSDNYVVAKLVDMAKEERILNGRAAHKQLMKIRVMAMALSDPKASPKIKAIAQRIAERELYGSGQWDTDRMCAEAL